MFVLKPELKFFSKICPNIYNYLMISPSLIALVRGRFLLAQIHKLRR